MRKIITSFLVITAFLLSCVTSLAAVWTPPNVSFSLSDNTPNEVCRWSAKNKVYFASSLPEINRKCLVVFDTDANGKILRTTPRQYAVLPSQTTAFSTEVWAMLLNTRDSKLYLGLYSYDAGFTTDISVISLDANGEPTGSPQAFASETAGGAVHDFALHPTLDRLYYVSITDPDVKAFNLTTAGVPTGSPLTLTLGGAYGCMAVGLNPNGTKLYAGSYEALESITLDASGNKTGSTITKTVTGLANYLDLTNNSEAVYFRRADTGKLSYWDLTTADDPTGSLVNTTRVISTRPRGNTAARLCLVEPITFTDAISGTTGIEVGFKVTEYAVTTAGAVSTAQNNTSTSDDTYDKVSVTAFNFPDPVVSSTWMAGPFGNRFKNVAVRYTLNSITTPSGVAPSYKLKDISATEDYTDFAVSARWGKVYMTNPAANQIRTYNIDADTFASNVSATTVANVIAVNQNMGSYGRLYYARTNNSVDYRNLASTGNPGTSIVNNATDMTSIKRIAVNNEQNKVYLAGYGGTAGQVGATEMYKLPSGMYVTEITVCDRLHKAYVTSMLNGNTNLWVWNLNADGSLATPMTPAVYSDGLPTGFGSGYLTGAVVHPTLNKLYVSGYCESATQGYIAVHDLDANGLPTGTVNLINARGMYPYTNRVLLKSDASYLYYGSNGDTGIFGVALETNGLPAAGATHYRWNPYIAYGPEKLDIYSDDLRIFAGVFPHDLCIFDIQSNGQAVPAPDATLTIALGAQNENFVLKLNTPTSWINCNTGLANLAGHWATSLAIACPDMPAGQVKVEFSTDNGTTVAKTATIDTTNNAVCVWLPGYDSTASVAASPVSAMKTNAEQLTAYHNKITTPVDTPPTSYAVGDSVWYMDGVTSALNTLFDIMKDMGINRTMVNCGEAYSTDISSQVHTTANNNGVTKFLGKYYEIPSFFDFNTEFFEPGYQENWAAERVAETTAPTGCTPSEIGGFVIHDEACWYQPLGFTELESEDAHKDVFIDYLQSINSSASWFGLSSWNYADVHCGRLDDTSTTAKRRLWYWTCRYFVESYTKSAKVTADAILDATSPSNLVYINLNNWPMTWFVPHPGAVYNNNFDMGLSACTMHPDWFDLARNNVGTCLWTEDWFFDVESQRWSLYADMLRCATRNSTNGMTYGAYITGVPLGEIVNGGQYKILSLAGHGGKSFESWCFGPTPLVDYNGYSDCNYPTMQEQANAYDLLGSKQSVLYPGKPRTAGTVAIHMSVASQPWDADGASYCEGYKRYWKEEIFGLHAALIHNNFPVDFVDDKDIENGKLATYGYKTLYITGPNLSTAAQTAINTWVNAGGTCVVLPGAARKDQYNDAATTIYNQLGCTQAAVPRLDAPITTWQDPGLKQTISVLSAYQASLGAVSADVYGQACPLTVTTGTQMATMTGGSAIVSKTYGSGRYMTYGFWPGNQYWNGADCSNTLRLPISYNPSLRALITAPSGPNYGNAKKFATSSVAMVETALLEDVTAGIGITLLNWGEAPVTSTTISVNKLAMPTNILNAVNAAISGGTLVVNSAKSGTLSYSVVGNDINITLPVTDVDVLTLTW